jgi:hypothetical protein
MFKFNYSGRDATNPKLWNLEFGFEFGLEFGSLDLDLMWI